MTFILDNWMWIALAITSGVLLVMPALQGRGLTPTQAVQLINRDKAVVVDVCSPDEFKAGHIVGARNVPLGDLESKLPNLVKNKSVPVIFACQSGMRSARAVALAKKLGYEQAQSLGGGLKSWKEANLPTENA